MIEPAALTPLVPAGLLVLPPVTDVFRDEELDVLETKVAGAEIASGSHATTTWSRSWTS